MPIQHWILRDFCRFWNSLLQLVQRNTLLHWALQQQVRMLQLNRKCLLSRWQCVLQKVLPNQPFHQALSNMLPIDEHSLLTALECSYHAILASAGDPSVHPCPHRRIAFTYTVNRPMLRWHKRPQYMHLSVPQHVKKTWIAFLAGACTLIPANDYNNLYVRPYPNARPVKVPYQHITCTKCASNAVADETHVLLHCPSTSACRQRFTAQHTLGSSVRAFLCTNHSNTHVAFFVHQCVRIYSAAPDVTPRQPIQADHPQQPLPNEPQQLPHTEPAPESPTAESTDSTVTANMGSLSASEYDNASDTDSEDQLTHISRWTENQPLLYQARMRARMHLRRIDD